MTVIAQPRGPLEYRHGGSCREYARSCWPASWIVRWRAGCLRKPACSSLCKPAHRPPASVPGAGGNAAPPGRWPPPAQHRAGQPGSRSVRGSQAGCHLGPPRDRRADRRPRGGRPPRPDQRRSRPAVSRQHRPRRPAHPHSRRPGAGLAARRRAAARLPSGPPPPAHRAQSPASPARGMTGPICAAPTHDVAEDLRARERSQASCALPGITQ